MLIPFILTVAALTGLWVALSPRHQRSEEDCRAMATAHYSELVRDDYVYRTTMPNHRTVIREKLLDYGVWSGDNLPTLDQLCNAVLDKYVDAEACRKILEDIHQGAWHYAEVRR